MKIAWIVIVCCLIVAGCVVAQQQRATTPVSNKKCFTQTNYRPTIFTSYCCDESDPIVQRILARWRRLNPNCRVLYFSDAQVKEFFKTTKHYKTYLTMSNGVAIADFFRICYINTHGGFWFDIDLPPSTVPIGNHSVQLFDCGWGNISYMMIGGSPNQKLFDDVIAQVVQNIHRNTPKKIDTIVKITGPGVIQKLLMRGIGKPLQNFDFKAKAEPQIFLAGSDYEFLYHLGPLGKTNDGNVHKTDDYVRLQRKYKKKRYTVYNYI